MPEFGSYALNPFQGSNLAFVIMECARRGFSSCQYCFCSNDAGWVGDNDDKYVMTGDPLRLKLALMGAYLHKQSGSPTAFEWGGDSGSWQPEYSAEWQYADGDRNHIRIKGNQWSWSKSEPWNWLVKPF